MTPYQEECERLRKIAAKVKPEDIWAQVYSVVYAKASYEMLPGQASEEAIALANQSVQKFEEHIKNVASLHD